MANEEVVGGKFTFDISELKAGIAEANRSIAQANAEFSKATSGMDKWTDSAEGLTAKTKQLNTIIEQENKKLKNLKQQYEQVAEAEGENSAAAQRMLTQITKQEASIGRLNKQLKDTSGALDEFKKKQDEASKSSGKFTEGLKTIAGGVGKAAAAGVLALGAAAVGAVAGFLSLAESTRETREQMAMLETAFESSGHSAEAATETYNNLYGILGDSGQATEAAQQLAKISKTEADLAANTKILTGVMAEYGDSIPTEGLAEGMAATAAMGEVQGVLADALEWQGVNLEDYNAKLATMATEEERAAYIQQSLTDLYGASAEALEEKNKSIIEAREAEAELTRVTAELGAIAEPIMTTLKQLATELLEAITPFVQLIGEGLTEAFNGSAGGAAKLSEGLSGILNTLVEKVTNTIPTILEIILQLVPKIVETLLGQLPKLLNLIVDLSVKVIDMITQLLPQIVDSIMKLLPILIKNLIAAIPKLLQAAVKLLMAIVEAIPTIIKALVNALPDIISTIVSTLIKNIPMIIKAAIDLFMGIIKAIPEIVISLQKAMPNIIKGIVEGLIEGIPDMISAGGDLLGGLLEGLVDFKAIGKAIKKLGDKIVSGFKSFFGIHSPSTVMRDSVGKYLAQGLGVGFTEEMENVQKGINASIDFSNARVGLPKVNNMSEKSSTSTGGGVTVNQYNTYSQAHSRYELYKTKQQTAAAVRMATGGAYKCLI